jgi:hypothetical protein
MTVRSLFVLLALAAAACSASGTSARQCSRGSDCPSNVCLDDGTCSAGGGAGGGAGSSAGAGSAGSAGDPGVGGASGSAGATSSGGAGGTSSACLPNGDGVLTRAETPLGAGLSAKFRAASNITLSTAGTKQPDGTVAWDFSAMLAQDHDTILEAKPIAGQWFSAQFAGASYTMRLADSQDLLGVFEITDTSLLLRGVVSPTSGLTQTELTYSPPVTVLQFPLKVGASWTSQSTVTGTASGVITTYIENYQSKVDAAGTAKTPFANFPVLRTSVVLTRTIGVIPSVTRTYLFSSECFGTVAKMVSNTNETGAEFSSVAELSRLAP